MEGQTDCQGEADIHRIDMRMSFNEMFNTSNHADQGRTPRMK